MSITALPTPAPARDQTPSDFVTNMDNWFGALPTLVSEIDAAVTAFNFNATNTVSTTSLLISIASKSLTVETGKSLVKGMAVTIAYTTDATQWMRGEVTSYNSGTGALEVNVRVISQNVGTYATWIISQAAVEALVNYSKIIVHTGNGCGAVATKIRRFTTALLNTGTALTYADNANGGGTITVNEPGLYLIKSGDTISSGTASWGVSVNSNQLTTAFPSITAAHQIGGPMTMESGAVAGYRNNQLCDLERLAVGDVLRHHGNSVNDGTTAQTFLSVIKVASI